MTTIFNKKILQILALAYCCILGPGCSHEHSEEGLKEGDLLFQNLDCGELCDAIEAVTEGYGGEDFSHCAIVVKIDDTLKVVEAIGNKVQVNSLQNFFKRSGDTLEMKNITVGRVKHQFEDLIPGVVTIAEKMVNTPYDDEFEMNNGKLYCSELIYEAFKTANNNKDFFELEPMTFKSPETNNFMPVWVSYYEKLKKEIPEGQAGINPGLISRSNKIQIVEADHLLDAIK